MNAKCRRENKIDWEDVLLTAALMAILIVSTYVCFVEISNILVM